MAKRSKKKQSRAQPVAAAATAARFGLRRTFVIVAALGAAAVLCGFYFLGSSDSRPDEGEMGVGQGPGSGLTNAGYIDTSACAGCHAEIAESYSRTGMGRSFYRAVPDKVSADFTTNNTYYHKPSDRHYAMLTRDGKYYARRHQLDSQGSEINVVEKEIHYVMGSGNHARSYLHRRQDDTLVEIPVGWYAERGGFWAMSPGYDQPQHNGFRREVSFSCMSCHNGYPETPPGGDLPGRDARYSGTIPEGIDCQRCHGPGRSHLEAIAAARSEEEIRESILNPADLPTDRQLELCMQCHLETTSRRLPHSLPAAGRGAFSYRPGEPLAGHTLHFDHAPGKGPEDKFEIAHAAYRLRMSACFQQTEGAGGAMTCTTCHDPHNVLRGEEAVRHYVEVCEGCHEPELSRLATTGAHTAERDCLDCHMPKRRTDDVVLVAMTDHYIQRRKPDRDLLAALSERGVEDTGYRGEVVPYYPPDFSDVDRGDLYLAVAQVKEESNLTEGIERLAGAIEEHRPEEGDFYFQLAEAYRKAERGAEALAMYEEATKRDPGHQAAQRNYGVALAYAGKEMEAAGVLERFLNHYPDDPRALNNLGEVLLALGRVSEARDRLQEAVRLNPDMPDAHNNLALTQWRLGETEAAMNSTREALRSEPDHVLAHDTLANLLLAAGRAGEAEAHFREAVRLDPGLAGAHTNLGNLLATRGKLNEAIVHFRKAIESDDSFAEAHANLGVALASSGKLEQAKRELTRALEIDPEYGRAQLTLAGIADSQGDAQEARRRLELAARSADPAVQRAAQKGLVELGSP
jgi:tetratricopeptide (TPR) repeat protein